MTGSGGWEAIVASIAAAIDRLCNMSGRQRLKYRLIGFWLILLFPRRCNTTSCFSIFPFLSLIQHSSSSLHIPFLSLPIPPIVPSYLPGYTVPLKDYSLTSLSLHCAYLPYCSIPLFHYLLSFCWLLLPSLIFSFPLLFHSLFIKLFFLSSS